MYNTIQELGATLKDSMPTYDKAGNAFPPKLEITKDAQQVLEAKIKSLTLRCSRYLDHCGMKMPKPLWYYDKSDAKTHFSHNSFKYGHLLTF